MIDKDHLDKGSKLWFTSDTHFGSKRTLELSKRPFKTTEEMDKIMVNNWNELVSPRDTVIHIGDFGDYDVAKKLNGNIKLVFGNYEDKDYRDDREGLMKKLNDVGIDVVSKGLPFLVKHNGDIWGLTHKPVDARHYYETKIWEFMLFGHIHKLQMVKRYGLNVGVDCHSFRPIDVDTVHFYKTAIDQHYDMNVFL